MAFDGFLIITEYFCTILFTSAFSYVLMLNMNELSIVFERFEKKKFLI